MPVNIMIGILALLVALCFYSIGTWGAFRARLVEPRQLVFLWIGFVFDVLATAMMALQVGGLQNDLHTYLALIGMAGMLLCAAVGTWANQNKNEKVQALIARLVVAPWLVWVFVFIWGMVTRGSARMQ